MIARIFTSQLKQISVVPRVTTQTHSSAMRAPFQASREALQPLFCITAQFR